MSLEINEKKNVVSLLLAFVLVLGIVIVSSISSNNVSVYAQIPGAVPAEPSMLAYENAEAGFSIEHPAAWIPIEEEHTLAGQTGLTIVSFISLPEDQQDEFAESVSVYVQDLPQAVTLEQFSSLQKSAVEEVYKDAELLQDLNNVTLAGRPANNIVYDATLNTTLTQEPTIKGRVMEVWTVEGNKAYVIHFEAEASKYDQFLDQANLMIESFALTAGQPASATSADNNTTITDNTSTSTASADTNNNNDTAIGTNMTGLSETSGNASSSSFDTARQQFLTAWRETPFNVALSTFIEPNSDSGYGVYTEHTSSIYNPDDTVTLYLEPVGFTHKPVVGEQGEQLYQINLTASVQLLQDMSEEASASPPLNQTISDIPPVVIVSHQQNTELYMTVPVYLYQADPPIPEGRYTIVYTITDGETGQTFTIEKNITVAQTVTT